MWDCRHPRHVSPKAQRAGLRDRCLSEQTGVTPLAQVNQLARPLEHAKDYRRMKTTCSSCTKDRLALGYFG